MRISWLDIVFSNPRHTTKTTASATAKTTVDTAYGTPTPTCATSAAIVSNTLTSTTAVQYSAGT